MGRCQTSYFLFYYPCSADHERDWPPCKVVFFGLATNMLNMRNNNNNNIVYNNIVYNNIVYNNIAYNDIVYNNIVYNN